MLLNEDQECSKVAEMSSNSLSLEAARTEPLLHFTLEGQHLPQDPRPFEPATNCDNCYSLPQTYHRS